MKKVISAIVVLTLTLSMLFSLTACGKKEEAAPAVEEAAPAEEAPAAEEEPAA